MTNLSDVIDGADLYDGTNYIFTTDRRYSTNSAVYFNVSSNYFKTPARSYISGDFTLIVWVKLFSSQAGNTIVRFGNSSSDVIKIYMDVTGSILRAHIYPGTINNQIDAGQIDFGVWLHIALGIKNTSAYFYLNGQMKYNRTLIQPNNVTRFGQIGPCDAIIDEVKIYSGSLNLHDILNDYNSNLPSNI